MYQSIDQHAGCHCKPNGEKNIACNFTFQIEIVMTAENKILVAEKVVSSRK